MKIKRRHHLIVLLLGLLFAAPGLLAYFFYAHPEWLGKTKTNKGAFITPPQLFVSMGNKPKWQLVYWSPEVCNESCLNTLYKLKRIRLALGRRYYQVDQWLLMNEGVQGLEPSVLKKADTQLYTITKGDALKCPILQSTPGIFIVSPAHYSVLVFAKNAPSEDIFHDIKQVLTVDKANG